VKKEERGKIWSSFSDDDIQIAQWKDYSLVSIALNVYGCEPLGNVNRYCSKKKN
jgi:hypothetical protein